MKKSIFYTSFAILSLVFVLASCNKYEEGANFSLRSAKARLVGVWDLEKVTVTAGGFSSESTSENVEMEIKKGTPIVFSAGTKLVSPNTIARQFNSELKKRVKRARVTFFGLVL